MNAENRDMNALVNLEARLSKLEKASRRWRLLCFAVMVLAVGMGAKFAVMDAEFKNVTVNRLDVVGPNGELLGQFGGKKMENGEYDGVIVAFGNKEKKITTIVAGDSKVYSLEK